ncbi:phosphate:acyl-[acyl carrier protein] acyltransferase [Lentimicrobium saccharophilum]|uniref:Phosphate acyltransferase n=1 Tax=Lentimicrobium saccharophilum TaxID=1678841 RepID=A0A0S7BVX0_9BACT|nr:phosphate acyltransferase PlsX [Lentimicrobium saccharophilum]GAP41918.1 phosphate:acyl-[acyl carrier protein] acyltransferase [Lentimicrobium saccharophilum]
MKIGLDVMGGDFAPVATIAGALLAQKELSPSDRIVLIGETGIILGELEKHHADPGLFDIVHAHDVIGMGEHPTHAIVRKPESSISIGFKELKHKRIDAFASAGSSGAMLVGAIYSVNNIQGVIRPCTSTVLPQENGGLSLLLDIGTNPDAKPDVMYQFGLLGSIMARNVYKINNPRVALLNIGHEEGKGNLLSQATYQLMKEGKDFNFTGNIESRDLFKSKADVIVCDGFTGNILLKNIEGMFRMMMKRGITDDYFTRFNYENYGGTPVLGINSTVIVGHGISNDVAIKNMLLLARDVYHARLSQKIKRALSRVTVVVRD